MTTLSRPYHIVIKSHQAWLRFDWRGLVDYRDLMFLLVRRDFISRYKQTVLGVAWAVLQPLIEKVTTKQRESFGGFGGFGRGGDRGGRGGDGNNTSDRPGAAERAALRTALESESTPADDLKAKLEALRASRKKIAAELAAAREDLKKVVTVRQEAVLVSMGILE